MSNIHKLPNARVDNEQDAETIAVLRDALARAERGEIQSVAIFATEPENRSTRAHHVQNFTDAQVMIAKAHLFIIEMCETISANATYFPIEPGDD